MQFNEIYFNLQFEIHNRSFMTFGTILLKIRLEKGISQAQVAIAIGIEQSTYSRIESDLHEPKAGVLMNIAQYYEIEISTLYPRNKDK